jgi:acetyltransferase-like isoleucine patch superfamily enzyme
MRLPFLQTVTRLLFGVSAGFCSMLLGCFNRFYRSPLFRSRCESCGRNLSLRALPHVGGHAQIFIGSDVIISGLIGIFSGRTFDDPTLIVGDRVVLSDRVTLSVNKRIVIEDDAYLAPGCYIADNDGHPRDPQARARGLPPAPEDVEPVCICRGVQLGYNCIVGKGVTIGEGARILPRSVIVSDVPPRAVAYGNPARIVPKA